MQHESIFPKAGARMFVNTIDDTCLFVCKLTQFEVVKFVLICTITGNSTEVCVTTILTPPFLVWFIENIQGGAG